MIPLLYVTWPAMAWLTSMQFMLSILVRPASQPFGDGILMFPIDRAKLRPSQPTQGDQSCEIISLNTELRA